MANILVNLVQLGFLGFSVAIMYLAYKLLKDLVSGDGENPQTLKLRLAGVISFLLLSAGVLVLGIKFASEDPNRTVAITIDMVPDEDRMHKAVRFKGVGEAPIQNGTITLDVKAGARLTFDVLLLRDELNRLEGALEEEKTANLGLENHNKALLNSSLEGPDENSSYPNSESGI